MKLSEIIFCIYSGLYMLGSVTHVGNGDYLSGLLCFSIALFAAYYPTLTKEKEDV